MRTDAEVRRRFAATPEKVFAAFAEPQLGEPLAIAVTRDQTHLAAVRLPRRAAATASPTSPPEAPTVIVGGAYRTIEPPSTIVFSWIIEPPDEHAGIDSEVTVTIAPDGGGTELVIRHEKLAHVDAVARHAEGWRGALDLLTALIETERRRMTAERPCRKRARRSFGRRRLSAKSRCSAGSASC